ncbi:hypothetical protein H4S07_002357 [Coemansia furcata]|uniref:Uncharacterized protein n=1 Tax=Coemansia furcata TaxID=417177 RepID=A0ACC1LLT7_9FUNG|nr:hypothetical protein H4S07_002357 [Coemansia furcata]
MKRQASQPVLSKVARKPSMLHTLVKRAGLGLVRRSVSLCKLVSGARTPSGSDGGCDDAHVSFDCNSSTTSSSSASVASSKHVKKPRRVLNAMRQAKNRLLKSLKSTGKHLQTNTNAADDDRDVVSAYPTDSAPGTELDSYLSLSAIHSPEGHMSAVQDGSSSDTHVGSTSGSSFGAGNSAASKYVPPKCPPYLGLHRRVAANVQRCDVAQLANMDEASTASDPYRQAIPPAALATPTRLRPTQFKSPFTTLPYGAYSQFHHVQAQRR